MSGIFYSRSEFTAPWGLAMPPMPGCMMFHVVTSGECWLDVDGEPPRLLRPGDFALVPHGEGHIISSAPDAPVEDLFTIPRNQISDRYETIHYGRGGAVARLVCGAVRFDHPAARDLLRLLPRTINVTSWDSAQAEWIQSTLRLMAAEARALQPGGETVMTRLADILVIQAIRSWIAGETGAQAGWLGALRDKQIGRAMQLIHREPAVNWSVASLAREAAMSRSAFAARFRELVGESPMQYVSRWRMQVAVTLLEEGQVSVGEMAERLGYGSEAAFSRAFKRVVGRSPGAVRRKGGTTGDDLPAPSQPHDLAVVGG
jgi:AraC-like DNA-binding protein